MRRGVPEGAQVKIFVRLLLAIFFVLAGRSHFVNPAPFAAIVPPPLPKLACVYLSGACEILGGIGLVALPRYGSWLLIATLLAVFPANIYMAVSGAKFGGFPAEPWMAWARLPLQFVLIWVVWWAGR